MSIRFQYCGSHSLSQLSIGFGKTNLDGTFSVTRKRVREHLIETKSDVVCAEDLSNAIGHSIKSKEGRESFGVHGKSHPHCNVGWCTGILKLDDSVVEEKLVDVPLRRFPFGIQDIGAILYESEGFRLWRYFLLGEGIATFTYSYGFGRSGRAKGRPLSAPRPRSRRRSSFPRARVKLSYLHHSL